MTGVYIIAEAGINHNGSLSEAIALIHAAKRCGADAIKFQTYITDDICRKDSPEYAMLKRCELSYSQFAILNDRCKLAGIDFISTPDTVKDAEFLDTLGMRYMKVGSANSGMDFIYRIKHLKTPLLISLGMGNGVYYEAEYMHCVSAYPCPLDQANMGRVDGEDIAGFSDHTLGSMAAIMAVARGAKFIEKHFTLDRHADGPDHHMSLEPDEMARYIADIRLAESALGDGVRRVMPCERATIEQLRARK